MRSFVRREGRITHSQREALATLAGRLGVPAGDGPLDLDALFGRVAPRICEIGCGAGETLAALARAHPENDYLGLEVYRPGAGRLLATLAREGRGNARVACEDAVEFLARRVPVGSLDAVCIFFPDPWPKKRHHKRRLVQSGFLACVRDRLRPHGRLYLATDWEDYALHMLAVARAVPGLVSLGVDGGFGPRPRWRPLTRFERRAREAGRQVRELPYARAFPA